MNWVLISVVMIVVIGVGLGWHAGFIKTVFHLCSFVAALLIAAFLAPPVANFLTEQDALMDRLSEKAYETLHLDELDHFTTAAEEDIEKLDIPDAIKKELSKHNTKENYEKLGVANAGAYISKTVAMIIIRCCSYLAVFLVALIALFLLSNALDLVSKIGFLDSVNKLAGAGIGFVEAAIIIALLMALLTALSNTGIGKSAMEMIADNAFLSYIYSHNPLNLSILNLSGKF